MTYTYACGCMHGFSKIFLRRRIYICMYWCNMSLWLDASVVASGKEGDIVVSRKNVCGCLGKAFVRLLCQPCPNASCCYSVHVSFPCSLSPRLVCADIHTWHCLFLPLYTSCSTHDTAFLLLYTSCSGVHIYASRRYSVRSTFFKNQIIVSLIKSIKIYEHL
jgi:hypothetical protein